MTQRWTFFAVGVMAGIIAVLGYALILQAKEPQVHAANSITQDSNPAAGILIASGGAQQNIQDCIWVLFKHQGSQKPDEGGTSSTADNILHKTELLSLACYQITNNGRNIKLVGVRNISWDMDLIELNNDKPQVMDIIKALRDEAKKKKDNK